MSEWTPRKPKPVQWWLEEIAQRALDAVVARMSGTRACSFGSWLGGMAWHFLPRRRRIVTRNLRIATLGRMSREQVTDLARESFRKTGANLVSVARTARIPACDLPGVLRIRNRHLLDDALLEGKGLVLLLCHMGNWELLSRMVHFFPQGTPGGAYYRPLNNPRLDRRVLERREADGVRMFSKRDNPLRVAAFLKEGGVVGILADQRVGPKGEPTRFFGRHTRSSPLPALLARRAKCPVIALSMVSAGPGVWEAEFIPVDQPADTGECMKAIETAMARSPADVFWFQERWKLYLNGSDGAGPWFSGGSSAEGMGHRALLWTGPEGDETVVPQAWRHADISYQCVGGVEDSVDSIRARLRELEWAASLPVDFVLARRASSSLREACKAEAIPLVSLP